MLNLVMDTKKANIRDMIKRNFEYVGSTMANTWNMVEKKLASISFKYEWDWNAWKCLIIIASQTNGACFETTIHLHMHRWYWWPLCRKRIYEHISPNAMMPSYRRHGKQQIPIHNLIEIIKRESCQCISIMAKNAKNFKRRKTHNSLVMKRILFLSYYL